MKRRFETALVPPWGTVSMDPVRIYTGVLGQIGDIVMFTATVRRIRELFPRSEITFAVSERYREAGELVAGLPYVDHLFVTKLYFEKLDPALFHAWEGGWPVNFRGEDEIEEEGRHDIVFDTRPRHRRMPWWEHAHQVEEYAHMVGVPGPIARKTDVVVPPGTTIPDGAAGKIVLHNDTVTDERKAWPWEHVKELVRAVGPESVAILGSAGPEVAGVLDLRGRTTLAQAAAVIAACRCYVGIDSGLMWIAGSLQVPVVGLYGTEYIPIPESVQPWNPRARYLTADGPVSDVTPDAVLAAVQASLALPP